MKRRFGKRLALLSLPVIAAAGLLLAITLADYSAAGGTTGSTSAATPTSDSTQAAPTTTAEVKLTITPADANRSIDFGLARSAKPATFHFAASPALSSDRKFAYVPVDLIDVGGKSIDTNNITASAGLVPDSGGKTVTVRLSVDPKDAKPGNYVGDIEIQGTGITTAEKGKLTAILDSHSFGDYWRAFVAILIGIALGAIVKYASETGSKRGHLRQRLQTIGQMVTRLGEENFAEAFLERMTRARGALEGGQTAEAETAINAMWEKLDGLEDVATGSRHVRQLFSQQRSDIEAMGKHLSAAITDKLAHAVVAEEQVLKTDIDAAWDSGADSGRAQRETHLAWFVGYSAFLDVNASTPDAEWDKSPRKDLLTLYGNGELENAEALRKKPPAHEAGRADEAAGLGAERVIEYRGETLVERGSRRGGWWQRRRRARQRRKTLRQLGLAETRAQRYRDWFDDHATLILLVLTPIVIAFFGLLYVFANDTAFDRGNLADWGKLVAWGFAGQISGMTIAQAVGIGKPQQPATA